MSYVLGIPRYANVAPLYHFLEEGDGIAFRYGVPTQLNQWLLEGSVDLSLVSSYFYLKNADRLRPLPDFSIADLGPVYSVNLFHRKPWEALRRLAITTESATSVELLRYLLRADGVRAELFPEQGGLELLERYDGVLLIGDRAITTYCSLLSVIPESVHQVPSELEGVRITDLSMKWFERTRLPFVFAVWTTRKNAPPPPEIVRRLRQARSLGLGNLAAVAGSEAQRLGVPERLMQHYLWNFRYHLEVPDRLGLQAFAQAVGLPYPNDYWDV
ncbi:Chorismate dehydratase [Meiothermus luteus]|jgi:chorismate dehydratase|uniref:Chorismate dehydratase n=1 Tax=Meiothermus luteus TaxID=2026184 RepID=A0A399EDF3_9DEIN|nr:menaquinone biosynthesis protein [Meiothermus luteus]RIH82667.1 Chorismate dehydratase [Meiothermus luteus]RMH54126.1 MAG: solute-binding protein [Deinococcota bacterium]